MTTSDAMTVKMGTSLRRQAPTFAIIGVIGFVVDSAVTYVLVRWFGVNPFVARFPAFAVATVNNFVLNRYLTFPDTRVPWQRAFIKYVMICAVGFVVNYIVYVAAYEAWLMAGLTATPGVLPLFVALGAGVAMFVTFFGFRAYAFRV